MAKNPRFALTLVAVLVVIAIVREKKIATEISPACNAVFFDSGAVFGGRRFRFVSGRVVMSLTGQVETAREFQGVL